MQSSCVCCSGSQIISQTKPLQPTAAWKTSVCNKGLKWRGNVRQFTNGRLTWQENMWKSRHDIRSMNSNTVRSQYNPRMVKKNILKTKPYLSIDLQESLGVTGNTLSIWTPWSYRVTSLVYAQSNRKSIGDLMTKESGNRFHMSYLFCHYCRGTWTEWFLNKTCTVCKKSKRINLNVSMSSQTSGISLF